MQNVVAVDSVTLCAVIDADGLTDWFDWDEEVVVLVTNGSYLDAVDSGDYLFVHDEYGCYFCFI